MDFIFLLFLSVVLDMDWIITYAVVMLPTILMMYVVSKVYEDIKGDVYGANSEYKNNRGKRKYKG